MNDIQMLDDELLRRYDKETYFHKHLTDNMLNHISVSVMVLHVVFSFGNNPI